MLKDLVVKKNHRLVVHWARSRYDVCGKTRPTLYTNTYCEPLVQVLYH